MAKELPPGNVAPGVFQLFNENRTFFFESDISSLPNPPCTEPLPTFHTVPTLHKSHSQPQLSIVGSLASLGRRPTSAASGPKDDLHMSTAIMASAPFQDPSHSHLNSDKVGSTNSLESRYDTEPAYRSSQILKSFKHEFSLFGQNSNTLGPRRSVSNPTSPRHRSDHDGSLDVIEESRPRASSDVRKLSMVAEESISQGTGSDNTGTVAQPAVRDVEVKSQGGKSGLLGCVAKDTVDGAMSAERNLPLTRQVMDWFTTPQTQPSRTVNRTEFNAISPQSF